MDDDVKPDGPEIQHRVCEACGQVKRLTPGNWPRVAGTQHTFQPICKSCFKAQKTRRQLERVERRATVNFLKKSGQNGGSSIPHSSELLESLMGLFGGVNGFANSVALQYHAAPPGGRVRTAILEMMTRLVVKNSEEGGAAKPTALMSDEELEAAIGRRLANAVETHKNLQYIEAHREAFATPQGLMAIGSGLSEDEIVAAKSMLPGVNPNG